MGLVYYSQEDPRWKNDMYSNHKDPKQTIGASACGPTSFAMTVSSLTGKQVLPPVMAKYSVDNGFRTNDNGTAWGFFGAAAKKYGLTCKQTDDIAEVKKALSTGAIVVASMRLGHFTGGGHYIVLTGVTVVNGEAWFDVMDPNIDNRKYGNDGMVKQGVKDDGRVSAKELLFRREAAQYWIFTYPTVGVKPKMTKTDAELIIASLSTLYNLAKTPAERNEIHRQANVVRAAAGLPIQ